MELHRNNFRFRAWQLKKSNSWRNAKWGKRSLTETNFQPSGRRVPPDGCKWAPFAVTLRSQRCCTASQSRQTAPSLSYCHWVIATCHWVHYIYACHWDFVHVTEFCHWVFVTEIAAVTEFLSLSFVTESRHSVTEFLLSLSFCHWVKRLPYGHPKYSVLILVCASLAVLDYWCD